MAVEITWVEDGKLMKGFINCDINRLMSFISNDLCPDAINPQCVELCKGHYSEADFGLCQKCWEQIFQKMEVCLK